VRAKQHARVRATSPTLVSWAGKVHFLVIFFSRRALNQRFFPRMGDGKHGFVSKSAAKQKEAFI
jgi:hypothetical protein